MIFYYTLVFSASLLYLLFYKKISEYFLLIDNVDNERKIHTIKTPRSGGIFFFLSLSIFFIFEFSNISSSGIFTSTRSLISFYFMSVSIFLIGLYDDKFNLSANKKFIFSSIIIFTFLILDSSLIITELRFSISDNAIPLHDFGIYFTLFCLLLLINAINMFDGMNLQVGLYFLIFLTFFILNSFLSVLVVSLMIPLLFFLFLNKTGKIFLGDSGSLICGILMGLIIIKTYNLNYQIYCDQIFLMLAIPGIDMLRLSIERLLKGKSIFEPDNKHIHHIMLKKVNFITASISMNIFFIIIFFMILLEISSYFILFITLLFYTSILMGGKYFSKS